MKKPILLLLGVFIMAVGFAVSSAEKYAGTDSCVMCHEDVQAGFEQSLHSNIPSDWNNGIGGCEACHGPGAAHADSGGDASLITNPKKDAGKITELCLECHEKGERKYWKGSAHDGRSLSCNSCHTIHQDGKPNASLLNAKTELETCTECHHMKKGQIMKSSHMPMREEKMTCSACHNSHGSNGPAMLHQLTVNDNCYDCHAEKRAPLLWEHPPVKEDCLVCHNAHGGIHSNMLNTKQPQLCQQCHDENRHPTTPYGEYNNGEFEPDHYIVGKACLSCHPMVHGTNHPAGSRLMR